ncbi:MAG: fused MFS/spermidine synthase [Candidatus Buchananbacteria bacterium]|nr:fused MFS/spermidine synthase [Candidatus Buchananbacteria bacterium]
MKVILKKIGKLEIIIFVSGSVVMVLELIGSRIVAPYLGTSIFVWASLIGIILGALSLGYYLGGRFSKTNPNLQFLGRTLLLAGLSILLITLIQKPVLTLAMQLGVKTGSVVATLGLFTIPSIIMGIVSPYAIRLKTDTVEHAGGVAGNLYALSTIGSIAGTFLAGFYLIPTFGSQQILFGLSITLILVSLLANKNIFSFLILLLAFNLLGFSSLTDSKFVYESESAYNHIIVKDGVDKSGRQVRALYLATELHSIIYKDSTELASKYHQNYALDTLFKPDIATALSLGGGAYVAPQDFLRRFPDAKMTVVEIDPEVTAVARDFFGLKSNPRLTIRHEDGRIFLNNNQEKFDVIYGDAFASYYSIPFQLTTAEAVKKMHDALTDDGILILNVISGLDGDRAKFLNAEYLTIKQYFPQIYLFPVDFRDEANFDKIQNIVLIATKNSNRLSKEEMLNLANANQVPYVNNLWEQQPNIKPTDRILTDDFAPVDYYISKFL